MNRTLVIIPAFNEEEALPGALAALRSARPDVDVVVVDDGSADATGAVARAGGAAVVTLPYNLGIGGALRAGFRYAVRHGYQRAVQFDGDGQHDPASIAVLEAALAQGADLVIGSRFAASDDYEVSQARGLAMGLLRLLVRVLTGERFTDTTSGCRGFSAEMLQFFGVHYPVEYMESVEALILAHGAGFRVVEVPVRMSEREGGVASNRGLRLAYHFCRVLVVMAVSKGAMRRPGLPGAASTEHTHTGARR
jgi:glycosyltransferase involved in cell wall biosynthesis